MLLITNKSAFPFAIDILFWPHERKVGKLFTGKRKAKMSGTGRRQPYRCQADGWCADTCLKNVSDWKGKECGHPCRNSQSWQSGPLWGAHADLHRLYTSAPTSDAVIDPSQTWESYWENSMADVLWCVCVGQLKTFFFTTLICLIDLFRRHLCKIAQKVHLRFIALKTNMSVTRIVSNVLYC